MSQVKHIHFVRHARPEHCPLFLGRTDIAVDSQANADLIAALTFKPTAIFSSPLRRCRALAEGLQAQSHVPLYYLDALQERDWGEWDGVDKAQIDSNQLAAYYADPFNYVIPAAESWTQMRARVLQAWLSLLQSEATHLVCITHGGVMRLLSQQLLALPDSALFQLGLDYGAQITWRVTSTETTPFVELIHWQASSL
jgi:alpha-ribazole phosphatase